MKILLSLILGLLPFAAMASDGLGPDLSRSAVGIIAILIFVAAYVLVMLEDVIHLQKSKPVVLAAGLIWAMIAFAYRDSNPEAVEHASRHQLPPPLVSLMRKVQMVL